jgi:hypothetical protein
MVWCIRHKVALFGFDVGTATHRLLGIGDSTDTVLLPAEDKDSFSEWSILNGAPLLNPTTGGYDAESDWSLMNGNYAFFSNAPNSFPLHRHGLPFYLQPPPPYLPPEPHPRKFP